MKYRLFFVGVTILTLLFSIGCKGMIERREKLKDCDFTIKKVRIEDIGLTGLTLNFDVNIDNPNQIDVVIDKMDINLWVNDNFVGRGFNQDKITIKSREQKLCTFSARIKYEGTYRAIQDLIKSIKKEKGINWRIKGKVYFQTIFGDIVFSFEKKGKLE